jgi:hypothetical protein
MCFMAAVHVECTSTLPVVFAAGRFSAVRGWTDDQKLVMSRRAIVEQKK